MPKHLVFYMDSIYKLKKVLLHINDLGKKVYVKDRNKKDVVK